MKYLAQDITIGGSQFHGPLQNINTIGDLINRLLLFLLPLAGIILFISLVLGGFDFLGSQGNPEKIKSGRAKIMTGLIGFLILVFAYAAAKVLAFIFGLTQNGIL